MPSSLSPSLRTGPPGRRRTPHRLLRLAHVLAARTDLWGPHVEFAQPTRHAARLGSPDGHEAWLLTWLPGQSTGLHDHGGSAGAFVVLEGVLDEATLAPSGRHARAALVHRRLETGRGRAFGPDHVHDVLNTGRVPAISVHVYSPELETMHRYVLDVAGLPQVASLERSGVDW